MTINKEYGVTIEVRIDRTENLAELIELIGWCGPHMDGWDVQHALFKAYEFGQQGKFIERREVI